MEESILQKADELLALLEAHRGTLLIRDLPEDLKETRFYLQKLGWARAFGHPAPGPLLRDIRRRVIPRALAKAMAEGGRCVVPDQATSPCVLAITDKGRGRLVESRSTRKGPDDATPADATLTGVAPRNNWFLRQYEARGTDTYHKPKTIQAKWWAMKDAERAAICPESPGRVSPATVVQGIKRARVLRDGKPAKKRRRASAHKA